MTEIWSLICPETKYFLYFWTYNISVPQESSGDTAIGKTTSFPKEEIQKMKEEASLT